ncbi:hypothetical protein QIY50_07030 [Pseudomonas putida]|nr:hypothetical protein QIY50_07030 [Pseudomonas putida]
MLKPQYDTHAIDSISVTCEFTSEVTAAGLETIRTEAKRLQNRLPYRRVRRKAGQGVTAHEALTSAPEPVGYMFYSKNKDDEESDSFEIHEAFARYTTQAYSNFNSFVADSSFYLETANTAFEKSNAKLKRVVVRFLNKFVTTDENWEPSESLKGNSKYIPQVCLEKKGDFWHFAIGVFGKAADNSHLLHNIRASHGVQKIGEDWDNSEYIVTLDLVHVNDFWDPEDASNNFSEVFQKTLNNIRIHNSCILDEIVSDELSARIGLKKPKQE